MAENPMVNYRIPAHQHVATHALCNNILTFLYVYVNVALAELFRKNPLHIEKGVVVIKIDEIDKKILDCLIENGRMSYADIGKKLNLSRVTIRERVNQLVENGVIEQFSIIINSEAAGKKVSAFFEVDCEPQHLVHVAQTLANHPSVASCYQMTGPSTLHMHVLVEDFEQLEQFINEEIYKLEGITRVESHILLRRFKSRNGLQI